MPPIKSALSREGGWSVFSRKASPYIFIAPFFISFLIFSTFPIFYSFYLSLVRWSGTARSPMTFVGLTNYINLIGFDEFRIFWVDDSKVFHLLYAVPRDGLFWKSLVNTFVIDIYTAIPQHAFALFFAFILNQGFVKFKDFFKGMLFAPYITSSIAISVIFSVIYSERTGVLNGFLQYLDNLKIVGPNNLFPIAHPVFWLKKFTWICIAIVSIWQWTGWNTIIYLAGLQAIPGNLYEAARIDGASWGQIFFSITLPLLRPIIFFATTLTVIGQVQLFDVPMALLGGASPQSTAVYYNQGVTMALYLYQQAFMYRNYGTGAALSYTMCILMVVLSLMNRRFFAEKT
jgi:ABC-type sugar transport system permease subunit